MEKTTNAEKLIAYAFTNRDLLKQALVAAGSREVKNIDIQHDGANKGLAMVGDALIRLIIVDEWFSGHETRGEEDFTGSPCILTLIPTNSKVRSEGPKARL